MRQFHCPAVTDARRIVLLVALTLNGNAQTGQVFFQTTTFGIVGLAQNQAARLNVLNPGNSSGNHSVVCSTEMGFLDDQGHELKTSSAQVEWGKAVSLEINYDELSSNALRVPIRAVLKTALNPPNPSVSSPMPGSVCSFLPTLEIFDKATGKTQLILSEGRSMVLNTPINKPSKTPDK